MVVGFLVVSFLSPVDLLLSLAFTAEVKADVYCYRMQDTAYTCSKYCHHNRRGKGIFIKFIIVL